MASPEIRAKILSKASQMFAFNGYDAVSMRHVATEVGMTQANLYNHFKGKEDLVLSCLAYVFKGKAKAFEAILQKYADPAQRLEQSILWFTTLLFEDAVFAKLFSRELLVGDAMRLEFLTKNVFQEPFSILVRLIGDFVETTDPVLSALILTSTIIGYFQFSGFIHHFREARPEYATPKVITQYIMEQIHERRKIPAEPRTSSRAESISQA